MINSDDIKEMRKYEDELNHMTRDELRAEIDFIRNNLLGEGNNQVNPYTYPFFNTAWNMLLCAALCQFVCGFYFACEVETFGKPLINRSEMPATVQFGLSQFVIAFICVMVPLVTLMTKDNYLAEKRQEMFKKLRAKKACELAVEE